MWKELQKAKHTALNDFFSVEFPKAVLLDGRVWRA